MEKKSGKDTRVIIESKSEIELLTWGSGSLSFSSLISISGKGQLAKMSIWLSKLGVWSSSNGCAEIESWFPK